MATISPTDDPEWYEVSPEVTRWFHRRNRPLIQDPMGLGKEVPKDEPTRLWDRLHREEGALPLRVAGTLVNPFLESSNKYLLTTHPQPGLSHVYLIWVWKAHLSYWACRGKILGIGWGGVPRCLSGICSSTFSRHLIRENKGEMEGEWYADGEQFVGDEYRCIKDAMDGKIRCSKCWQMGELWIPASASTQEDPNGWLPVSEKRTWVSRMMTQGFKWEDVERQGYEEGEESARQGLMEVSKLKTWYRRWLDLLDESVTGDRYLQGLSWKEEKAAQKLAQLLKSQVDIVWQILQDHPEWICNPKPVSDPEPIYQLDELFEDPDEELEGWI